MAENDAAKGCGCILVILAIIGAGTYFWVSNRPPPTAEELAEKALEKQRIDAMVVSEDFVKDHLKFPNDASFPWGTTTTTPLEENEWNVRGQVTAKNAMGAELTYDWVTVVKLNPETEKWKLSTLVLDGETLVGE